jgi:hypothetical protein
MQETAPTRKQVMLASGAACAFALAAIIDVAVGLGAHRRPSLLMGIGFGGVAVLWGAIAIKWNARVER